MYKLPHKLLNDLRLKLWLKYPKVLQNLEIPEKLGTDDSTQMATQKPNFNSCAQKLQKNKNKIKQKKETTTTTKKKQLKNLKWRKLFYLVSLVFLQYFVYG